MGIDRWSDNAGMIAVASSLDSRKLSHKIVAWVMLLSSRWLTVLPGSAPTARALGSDAQHDPWSRWSPCRALQGRGDEQDPEAHLVGGALAPHDVPLGWPLNAGSRSRSALVVPAGDPHRVARGAARPA